MAGARCIDPQRPVVDRDRLVEIALPAPDRGLRGEGGEVLGFEPRRPLIIGDRAVVLLVAGIGLRPQHVILRRRRKPHGAVEVADGVRIVLQPQIDLPAPAIGGDVIAVEADGFGEIRQRLAGHAEIAADPAAVHISRGRIGIELDGVVVVGQRVAVIAARVIGIAAVLIGRREIGSVFDGAVEVGDGVRNVAAVEIGEAAHRIGDAERLAAQPSGFQDFGAGVDALVGQLRGLIGARLRGAAQARLRAARPGASQQDAGEQRGSEQPRWPGRTHIPTHRIH